MYFLTFLHNSTGTMARNRVRVITIFTSRANDRFCWYWKLRQYPHRNEYAANLVNNNIEQYLDIFNARRKCKMITKMESFIKSIFCNFFHDHYCFYFIPDCINFLSLLFFNLLSVNIVSIIFSGQQQLNVTSKLDCQC